MLAMKSFCAAVAIVFTSATAFAKPPTIEYTTVVKSSWDRMKRLLTASAEAMPEGNYAFRPTPDVRTFGELIGHLTEEHYLFCSGLKGEKNPKEGVPFEKLATKAEHVAALNDSITYCDGVYGAVKDDVKWIQRKPGGSAPFRDLLMNVTHDSEHYGNIVTYLRLKGIVPPSSTPSR